jgi:hypothetical protein
MAVAYDAQTRTTSTHRQFFPSIAVHMQVLTQTAGVPRPWLAPTFRIIPAQPGGRPHHFMLQQITTITTLALPRRYIFLVSLLSRFFGCWFAKYWYLLRFCLYRMQFLLLFLPKPLYASSVFFSKECISPVATCSATVLIILKST